MNHCRTFSNQWTAVIALFFSLTTLHANTQPKFVLTPTTPTTLNVNANATATVTYNVTNSTKITRTLTTKPIAGISQITNTPGACANPFTLAQNQSCSLTLQINGSQIPGHVTEGPVVCSTMGNGDNTYNPMLCSQPSQINSLNITRIELLPISVQPSSIRIEAGGLTGTMTVTNNSTTITATNVAANFTGTFLEGRVTQDATNCQTLQPTKSCTLTFTSGNEAVPSTSFSIQGDNTTSVTATMTIVYPTVANITVSGSPLYLTASSTPVTQYLSVHNTNNLLAAHNVAAVLTGDLATQVIQDSTACSSLPPNGYCNLAFTPVANGDEVPLTVVDVLGTNTTTRKAQIAVNSAAAVPISVTSGSPAILVADGTSNKTMIITNNSTTDAATNVTAILTGTDLENNVTVTSTGCESVAPNGGTCSLTFTAKTTRVPATSFTIQGDNTSTATPTPVILIGPPGAILRIAPNPAVLSLYTNGASGTFTITNLSLQVTAQNIVPTLSDLMAANVTLDNQCTPELLPNSSCTMTFTPLSTAVSLENFPIKGDNTTELGGAIQILSTDPTLAQIEVVAGNQLVLEAEGTGVITIKNISTSAITASQISAAISGTTLDTAGVTQDASACLSLAQGNTCDLVFTASTTVVTPPVTVNIFGSNTSTTTAQISVNGVPSLAINPTSIFLLADNTTSQSMTVTNNSTTTAAQGIIPDFSGTSLDGQVTTLNGCLNVALPPGESCTMTFTAGSVIVPESTFSVYGTNTSITQGTMAIGSYFAYVTSNQRIYRCLMNSVSGLLTECIIAQDQLDLNDRDTVLAIDPAGKYLYAAKSSSGIFKCPINTNDGTLSACTLNTTGLSTTNYTALTFDPSGSYLYAITTNSNSIQQCSIDTNGDIFNCAYDENAIPLTDSWGMAIMAENGVGTFAYLSSTQSPYQGSLCPMTNGDIGTCSQAYDYTNVLNGIALLPTNNYAYLASSVSEDAQRYQIDPTTHAFIGSPTAFPIGKQSCQVAVNSAGTFAYFTGEGNNVAVRACPIGNDGALGTCVPASDVEFNSCMGLALWEHPVQ